MLPCTQRGPHGFGSIETGIQDSKALQATTQDTQPEPGTDGQDTTDFLTTQLKTYQSTPQEPTVAPTVCTVHDATRTILHNDGIPPYNVWLSQDPFQSRLSIQIDVKGDHPSLGLKCAVTPHGRLQLMDMEEGTPAMKIPKWRSTLRRGLLLSVGDTPVRTLADLEGVVATARQKQLLKLTCVFATITSPATHPTKGSLHLYYDQLNVIGKHLQAMREERCQVNQHQTTTARAMEQTMAAQTGTPLVLDPDLGKFLSWKEIKRWPDIQEWRQSRFKMLDNYMNQGMFSEPMPKMGKANIYHMLWRYFLKLDGTRKSRMVCDGSARQGTITLGHTYANSLMAASERLFWALAATHGLMVYGADVTNAFAEAPPPVHPLYMQIDVAFREWWTDHLKRTPIPSNCTVVQVNNAIQGHPESPRLWEKHID